MLTLYTILYSLYTLLNKNCNSQGWGLIGHFIGNYFGTIIAAGPSFAACRIPDADTSLADTVRADAGRPVAGRSDAGHTDAGRADTG